MRRGCLKFYFRLGLLIVLLNWSSGSVNAQLRADFTMDKPGGCSPVAIKFTNQTSGASSNAVYSWDFGNENTSFLPDGGAIYTKSQTYTVTLTVTDGSNKSSKTDQVTVYENPTVDFSASVAKGCIPLAVNFTANTNPGNGSVNSYTWDFGDGNVQQGYTATQLHTYSVVQDPIVSLTATNSFGCHTTKQKTGLVDVIPALIPNISADKNFLCLITDPVQFSNSSAGPGTLSYLWDFGDGNSSSQKNPQYIFNKKGIYTVKLKVTSSEGCVATTTLSNSLNVASYTTDFNVPGPVCNGSSYILTNTSSPSPDNSAWYFDGNLNSYSRDAGYYASASGTHSVRLTNNFGTCVQTTTKNILVNDLPSPAGFTYAEQGKCGTPETVTFSDLSNATKWEWDFQYNNYQPNITSTVKQPGFKYTNPGIYNIWLRSTNAAGCSITSDQSIYLAPPFIYISSNSAAYTCLTPNTQHFSVSPSNFSSFTWHFGDGTTSTTEISPTHVYNVPGDYSVYLSYTTTDGCSGTSNTLVRGVSTMPVIDFSAQPTSVCGNNNVYFQSVISTPNLSSFTWDFGDNSGYNGYNSNSMEHNYTASGKYTVSLTVTNTGCTKSLIKTDYITVKTPFIGNYSHSNTCTGDRGDATFNGSATGATSLLWDFGDGSNQTTTGDVTSLTHHYTKDGVFNFTVTASDDQNNCSVISNYDQVIVLHKQNPVLTGDKKEVCTSDILNIDLKFLFPPGFIYDYFGVRFEYGDGTPYAGDLPNYSYSWQAELKGPLSPFEKGKQGIRAITTSSYYYCQDTSNFIPLVISGIKAGLEIVQDHQCFQNPVILKDASTVDPGNSVKSRTWDFGDGTAPATGETVSHNYLHPGNYPVRLTVTDAKGCSATSSDYATSYATVNGPEALFNSSGNNVSLNSTVYFYNGTNTFGSYNTTYSWTISDGTTSTDYNISHTFPVAGDYTVTLTARDATSGCSSTTSQVIHVSDFNTSFSMNKSFVTGGCPPVLVTFNNTSYNYTRIKWDFGDGFTADNLNSASHIYKDPGKYIITLTGYAPNGLTDQFFDSVIIKIPSANMTAKPLEACIGGLVKDTAISLNAGSFTWDFGDGSITNSTEPTASHQYESPGIYEPKLLITDANGCNTGVNMTGEINIHPNPEIIISPANATICEGARITLSGNGGSTYKWTPATGLDNDVIPSPMASPVTTTSYTLEITDGLGCKNSASVKVTVINAGKLIVNNDTTVCEGDAVQLHASGKSSYTWIQDTDGLDNTEISNPVAKPQTTTQYTVSGTDANNCFPESAQITVQVLPLPLVDAGQDTTLQAGASFHLNGTGSNDIVQWNWEPAKYLSCSDCAAPLCKPLENMNYILTAKSDNGCYASSHVTIKMECDEARISIPNGFTPNRDGKNDLFVIHGISFIKHMMIFDRWGDKVFERNNFNPADPASCWDGTQHGMEVPSGTYVYFIEMQCPGGGAFSRKGSVVLLR